MPAYKVRQHLVNAFGQKVIKIKTLRGELASGLLDKNGKEIFANDKVRYTNEVFREDITDVVRFESGAFWFGEEPLETYDTDFSMEVVGHKGD